MNAMAGGGSFISFPAMLSIGVAPIQANATNTVALWPGQLTSVAALRGDLRRDLLPVVCAASVLGGVSGAVVLLNTRQVTFLHIVPWLLLVASLLFGISGPVSRWLRARSAEPHVTKAPRLVPSVPCVAAGLFLYRLLWRWRRLPDYERAGAVRCGGDACTELTESAGGLLVELLRCGDVCAEWSGDLALLPDFDGVCAVWVDMLGLSMRGE